MNVDALNHYFYSIIIHFKKRGNKELMILDFHQNFASNFYVRSVKKEMFYTSFNKYLFPRIISWEHIIYNPHYK